MSEAEGGDKAGIPAIYYTIGAVVLGLGIIFGYLGYATWRQEQPPEGPDHRFWVSEVVIEELESESRPEKLTMSGLWTTESDPIKTGDTIWFQLSEDMFNPSEKKPYWYSALYFVECEVIERDGMIRVEPDWLKDIDDGGFYFEGTVTDGVFRAKLFQISDVRVHEWGTVELNLTMM